MASKNLPYCLLLFSLFFTLNISSSFAMGGKAPTSTPPSEALKKENQDLQEKLRMANENLRASEASILMLKKEIDLTKNQLNELNDFLNNEKLTNKGLLESLKKRDEEKIVLQSKIADLNSNVSDYRSSLENQELKLNQANQEIISLQNQITSIKSESESEIAKLESDLSNLTELSAEEKKKLQTDLEKTIKESEEKISLIESQILALEQTKGNYEKEIATLTQKLESAELQLSKYSDYIPSKAVFTAPIEAKPNKPFEVIVEVKNKSDKVVSSFIGKLELIDTVTNEVIKKIDIVNGSTKTSIMRSQPGFLSLGIRDPMLMLDTLISQTIKIQDQHGHGNYQETGNLQTFLNQYVCPNGRIPEITFSASQYYQGEGNTTQISSGLQPTPIGGVPSNSYVGVNLGTKDVIYITKMTDGGRVVGFNITLSLCKSFSSPQNIPPSRMPIVAEASPFIVMDPTNCPTGSVDQGAVILSIPEYHDPGTNAVIPAIQTQIAFTRPPSCLGGSFALTPPVEIPFQPDESVPEEGENLSEGPSIPLAAPSDIGFDFDKTLKELLSGKIDLSEFADKVTVEEKKKKWLVKIQLSPDKSLTFTIKKPKPLKPPTSTPPSSEPGTGTGTGGFVPGPSPSPGPGYDTGTGNWSPGNFSQGQACWTWTGTGTPTSNPAAPTVTNSGTWNWISNYRCWIWTGSGTPPTPSKPSTGGTPGYEYPPGQVDPGYTSDCYAKGVSTGGGGTLPYYRIPVSGHGNPGNLVWSSSALSTADQKILTTDARFNLRIVAKAAPAKGTTYKKGATTFTCNYEGLAYTKIKLTVGLRKPNSNVYTAFYDLSEIPVGKCSNVLEFTDYQIPVTDGPIVLDIFNFKHDFFCKVYENSANANNPYYCPYTPMYSNDCFSIEVQFSTDYTLDIPH